MMREIHIFLEERCKTLCVLNARISMRIVLLPLLFFRVLIPPRCDPVSLTTRQTTRIPRSLARCKLFLQTVETLPLRSRKKILGSISKQLPRKIESENFFIIFLENTNKISRRVIIFHIRIINSHKWELFSIEALREYQLLKIKKGL